ncbi:MAG: Asp-tRNA(Asn)/Glu-tRNA(Gln) amidotransferase subunit GatB [Candidatus Shapirobacteria bacterium]|jgi:aspartyl-tRNA(Asn)/glutamyl-tRNA(Gln) amidotransferase subunit B
MTITPIIGLEVHVELKTKSKMFCGCDATHFHIAPNTHTCPVCLGLPGALPVPNRTAIDWCLKLGLALNCSVNSQSFFERKNYFYPDLPKGYQISQYQKPFTVNGFITINGNKIRINRAHLEEDTAKSVHLTQAGEDVTLIDFNRSGVPLVEIVSEPDIGSSSMAKDYLVKIQQLIRYLEISDADIEQGSMRCEPTVNLKIETDGKIAFTPLVEVKNIASLTGVQAAIDYELDRQFNSWKETGITKADPLGIKTTRGWDAAKQQTFLQRQKEGSSDYRYFPEPDIPPFEFTPSHIAAIHATLPELPDQKITRYQKDFSLSQYDSETLAANSVFAKAYDQALGAAPLKDKSKFIANLFLGPLKTYLNETSAEIDLVKINPDYFSDLFNSVSDSELSATVAKQVIVESYQTGQNPVAIAKTKGLVQVSDTTKIEALAKEVIAANPKVAADYQKNPNVIGFLIGQLMKASGGSANPKLAKEILEKLLT